MSNPRNKNPQILKNPQTLGIVVLALGRHTLELGIGVISWIGDFWGFFIGNFLGIFYKEFFIGIFWRFLFGIFWGFFTGDFWGIPYPHPRDFKSLGIF